MMMIKKKRKSFFVFPIKLMERAHQVKTNMAFEENSLLRRCSYNIVKEMVL